MALSNIERFQKVDMIFLLKSVSQLKTIQP